MSQIQEKEFEVADRLEQCRDLILTRWIERVLSEIPAAKAQDRTTLLNSLPNFLDGLGRALLSKEPSQELSQVGHEYARQHGKARALLPGYSLDQVISEYDLFRQALFTELEEGVGHLGVREREIILHAVFTAVKVAVTEFVHAKGIELFQKNEDIQRSNTSLQTANDTLHREKDLREQVMRLIAHDLRSPLTAAKASAQLIARKPERTDAIPQLAVRVIEAMDRADRMIQNLLDSSQIRAGKKLALQLADVNLSQLLKQTWEEFSSIHGSRFKLKTPKDEITVQASQAELRRALENLVNNAVKYSHPETAITLGLDVNKNKGTLWVHNFGHVLSPKEQENLFHPFSRTKAVEEHGIKGWGLGLTIVQGVADAHGGKASVRSTSENGTTFMIELPR